MSKTIFNMLVNSKYRALYLALFVLISIILNVYIYLDPLNFSILLYISFVATYISLVLSFEVSIQESRNFMYDYLKTLKGENFVMTYRSVAIFNWSAPITIFMSILLNTIYIKDVYITQQLIYLALILLCNYFYIYFLQYVSVNIKNELVRNTVITAVTLISLLSLMTRSLSTYLIFVTITGLFLAITYMNRRLGEELKRESDEVA
ncbi:hypothetical protein RZE82_00525 [Mollicutes bacterium LVI A0039]|nr:hypothetical protein RZE82_00525 [Mollicutes bacterium LVI A0039]